jgi:hypothetical protein
MEDRVFDDFPHPERLTLSMLNKMVNTILLYVKLLIINQPFLTKSDKTG